MATVGTGWGVLAFLIGYAGNRGMSALSLLSTYYQERHYLNGTTGFDAWVATGGALIGLYPPASATVSLVQLLYDAARAGGMPAPIDTDFPNLPLLDELLSP
jgi:hypothetical protein